MKLFLFTAFFLFSGIAEANDKEKQFFESCVSTANTVLSDFNSLEAKDKEVNTFRCRNIANNINKDNGWAKVTNRSGCIAAIGGVLEDLVESKYRFPLMKKYCKN